MLKHVLFALALAVAAAGANGCGGGSGCLPAQQQNQYMCPPNIFIDATASDPVCLGTGGNAICRGDNDAVCYHCNGGAFTDGCFIKSGPTTYECVHTCDKC
jgi:hypothetical protein